MLKQKDVELDNKIDTTYTKIIGEMNASDGILNTRITNLETKHVNELNQKVGDLTTLITNTKKNYLINIQEIKMLLLQSMIN